MERASAVRRRGRAVARAGARAARAGGGVERGGARAGGVDASGAGGAMAALECVEMRRPATWMRAVLEERRQRRSSAWRREGSGRK